VDDAEGAIAHLVLKHIATGTNQTTGLLAFSFFPVLLLQRERRLVAFIAEYFVDSYSVCLRENFSVFDLCVEFGAVLLEGDGFDGSLLLEGQSFAFVDEFAIFSQSYFRPGLVV